MQEDRRKHPRHPCWVEVSVRFGNISYLGAILDYSEGGAFIATTVLAEMGHALKLRFRHPTGSHSVEIDAVVRRVVGLGSTPQGVGVQFNQLLSSTSPT